MDLSSPHSGKGIDNGEIRHSPRLVARASVQNYLLLKLTNALQFQENVIGTKKQRSPATPRWTKPEDVLLAECWANATKNPIKGTDQKMDNFWKTIRDLFQTGYQDGGIAKILNVPYESRGRDSIQLQNRSKILLSAVQVFCGVYGAVKAKANTGNITEDTVIENAKQMNLATEGKEFPHIEVWHVRVSKIIISIYHHF